MTASSRIDKIAADLYQDILAAYKANPSLTFTEVLQEHLAKFNDEIAEMVNKEIGNIINSSVGAISGIVRPMETLALSSLLYKNSDYVAKQVMVVINEHLLLRSTIDEIRKALYDGYGYGEILDIAERAKLPKYMMKDLTEAQIAKLKTKSLAAGYFGVLDAKTDKAMEKALYVAVQEKARYYALRIAQTEEQRAFNTMLAGEYLEEGVEYVRVALSSRHSTVCVCDYHANYNSGYGRGVYPLRSAPMPPFHPFCACTLRPVDNTRWRTAKPEGFLSDFTKQQQIDMQRGRDSKWNVPTVSDVF